MSCAGIGPSGWVWMVLYLLLVHSLYILVWCYTLHLCKTRKKDILFVIGQCPPVSLQCGCRKYPDPWVRCNRASPGMKITCNVISSAWAGSVVRSKYCVRYSCHDVTMLRPWWCNVLIYLKWQEYLGMSNLYLYDAVSFHITEWKENYVAT